MSFFLYSRTFIVSPAMRPPRIPVRSTPMVNGQRSETLRPSRELLPLRRVFPTMLMLPLIYLRLC